MARLLIQIIDFLTIRRSTVRETRRIPTLSSDMKNAKKTGTSPATHSVAVRIDTMRQRDIQHHTYADYLTWSAASGEELIDGVAYIREPPAPSRLHQEFVVELCRQVTGSLRGKVPRAYVAPFDVRLPKSSVEGDDRTDTVVQPDILIVCDRQKLDERGMRGAPDWIAEILSSGTASYDRTIKLQAYERAGVPEVWLVDPIDRIVTVYRIAGRHYTQPVVLELRGRTAITAVPGVSIDWDCLLTT